MIKMLVGVVLMGSGLVLAQEDCKVSSHFKMDLNDQELVMSKEPLSYRIDGNNQFFVNDEQVKLSAEEQEWVKSYKDRYQQFVQRVSVIAFEATDFGIGVASEALTKVMAANDEEIQALTERMQGIKAELKTSLEGQQVWSEERIEAIFNSEFSEKIETVAEEMAEKIPQKLFSFSFWKNLATLEEKMEQFEIDIEKRAAEFEKSIEVKAEKLKLSIAELNNLEAKLAQSNIKLKDFDIFNDCEANNQKGISVTL